MVKIMASMIFTVVVMSLGVQPPDHPTSLNFK